MVQNNHGLSAGQNKRNNNNNNNYGSVPRSSAVGTGNIPDLHSRYLLVFAWVMMICVCVRGDGLMHETIDSLLIFSFDVT